MTRIALFHSGHVASASLEIATGLTVTEVEASSTVTYSLVSTAVGTQISLLMVTVLDGWQYWMGDSANQLQAGRGSVGRSPVSIEFA